MPALPPVSTRELRRAIDDAAEESFEHVVLARKNGLALVARVGLLEAMLGDRIILKSRLITRDEVGTVLDPGRFILRVAAKAPLSSESGLEAALCHARKWVREIEQDRRNAYSRAGFNNPKAGQNQGEENNSNGSGGCRSRGKTHGRRLSKRVGL
jgi:hypothetical protein